MRKNHINFCLSIVLLLNMFLMNKNILCDENLDCNFQKVEIYELQ